MTGTGGVGQGPSPAESMMDIDSIIARADAKNVIQDDVVDDNKLTAQLSAQRRGDGIVAKNDKSRKKEKANLKSRVSKTSGSSEKEASQVAKQRLKDTAQQFQQRNPELKSGTLVNLRGQIKPNDSAEDILETLKKFYPDVSLADEALEYLSETTEGELHQQVLAAKNSFNEDHGREIVAGRNIHQQARQAASQGIGTPTSMRDMYRDVTGNPRTSTQMFTELSTKYAFKDLQKVTDFLLHSLGADLKSKGTSIPRGELHVLLTECRSLQAILGVYRFFQGRTNLVKTLFKKNEINVPRQLTFELMAKQFMSLASERYPSSDKVMRLAPKLGVNNSIHGKIITFSQFRDAIREVSVGQVYKSVQHRDELLMAIIEVLEDLEDELEELEDREALEELEEEKEINWNANPPNEPIIQTGNSQSVNKDSNIQGDNKNG